MCGSVRAGYVGKHYYINGYTGQLFLSNGAAQVYPTEELAREAVEKSARKFIARLLSK